MKAIFWKEWREMLPAVVLLAAAGAAFGMTPKLGSRMALPLLGIHACIGAAVGAWQAFRDRRAAGDEFLRHRPVAAWRMHAVRAAAGLVCVLAVSATSLLVTLYVPYQRGFEVFGALVEPHPNPRWTDFSPGLAAFAVLLSAATWAALRLGASMNGRVASIFLAAFLPVALVLSVSATSTDAGAVAFALASVVFGSALLVARQATGRVVGGLR